VVLDNTSTHKTPAIKRSLTVHPRFHPHFSPTRSSWLNLVERWFGEPTTKKLQRGTHRSIRELNTDIRNWIATWNATHWSRTSMAAKSASCSMTTARFDQHAPTAGQGDGGQQRGHGSRDHRARRGHDMNVMGAQQR
jgi:hypothetical protein